jgi:2-dehydro-3-deoxy-D-arabinonate dehydratase
MRLCRFRTLDNQAHVGLVRDDQRIFDLCASGIERIEAVLEADRPMEEVSARLAENLPSHDQQDVTLLPPVERQEVWAVGVTYLRSKKARMEESEFSATAYDRVYDAPRPELFFKALPEKTVGPGGLVGIRKDANWSVPEPELALVINSKGRITGYTIGNDMSARDIEGENLLYLPQAKIYDRSCAVGPWIVVGPDEAEARTWTIRLRVERRGRVAFAGETCVGQIKRSFDELVLFLFRSQTFPHGACLLTGTGIVPPDSFTLQPGDWVHIDISGIGTLSNETVLV